jgi:hypothetical protein
MTFVRLRAGRDRSLFLPLLLALLMASALGGCWRSFVGGWSDCVDRCRNSPEVRDVTDCNKQCHAAHSH